LFTHESEHLKLIGEMFDKCQSVLLQFLELVSSNIDDDKTYQQYFPAIGELCIRYKLTPEIAFFALRRVLHYQRIVQPADDTTSGSSNSGMDTNEDKVEIKKAMSAPAGGRPTAAELQQQRALIASKSGGSSTFQQLVMTCRGLLPSTAWHSISPEFYTNFWAYSLYDLYVPKAQYDANIARIKAQIATLDATAKAEKKENDEKTRKERDRLVKITQQLKDDLVKQSKNHSQVIEKMKKEKDVWLAPSSLTQPNQYDFMVANFMQYCILPRLTLSHNDAR
jgi:THO complex subunit 2